MEKTAKKSVLIILIMILLFVIIWFVYDSFKKEPANANAVTTNITDKNSGLDNVINDLFEKADINEIDANLIGNTIVDDNTNSTNETVTNTGSSTTSVTSKEQKAVALVKKAWGDTDGVYFSNMSIDNQGRYIVSVNDAKTTKTLAFFKVDVDKELVTKQ